MTSRVSFPKLLIETLRRHLAAVLITVLVFFIHLISFFLNVQNIINAQYIEDLSELVSAVHPSIRMAERITENLAELCVPNFTNGVIALLLGVYLAFDFFKYMHSKRQTDFYDSLPVRKEKWFLTIFTCCFGIFTILSVITIALETAIVFGSGYGNIAMFQNMLWTLLCMIGCFLAGWVTTTLSMIMTGNSIIAFLGVGVFASYAPLILNYLFSSYAATFYETYATNNESTFAFYFSPVSLAYKLTYSWYEWNIREHWTYMVGIFVFSIIVGILSYFLFLRRPSETAGRAMAFEKINPVIRILLVIPLALYAGLFLNEVSEFASIAWMTFGIIFAAFILHGVIECIFQFDIRALISKKLQLLFCIIFCFAFVAAYGLDLFKYDAYLPDVDDVEAIQVSSYMLNDYDSEYLGIEKDWVHGDAIEDALNVAKEMIDTPFYKDAPADSIKFTYYLKNGQTKVRRYTYSTAEYPESLDLLYTEQEFKDDFCALYSVEKKNIQNIICFNGITEETLSLSKEEKSEFIDTYLDEFTKVTYSQLLTEPSDYRIEFHYKSDYKTVEVSYNVYSSMTKTLAFLTEKGMASFQNMTDLEFISLEIYNDKYYSLENQLLEGHEKISKLKDDMIVGDLMFQAYPENYIYCDLRYKYNDEERYISVQVNTTALDSLLEQ